MLTTDETGSAGVSPALAYTAFGEPITPDGQGGWRIGFRPELGTRYQYAGGWGYETGGFDGQSGILALYGANPNLPPITLQHVGWRWYQPSTGRFIQRDPIGLLGGLNVYVYVRNGAILRVDPDGLIPEWVKGVGVVAVVLSIAIAAPPTIPGLVAGALAMTGTCVWGADELGATGTKIGETLRGKPPEDPPYPPNLPPIGDGWRADPRYPNE